MELWIQPCTPCADLYGQPSAVDPHAMLTVVEVGAVEDAGADQHYICTRCSAAFLRVTVGEPRSQVWMLLNAGQH
jgi:hypothetical protein